MVSTDAGMYSDRSDEHELNAERPRTESLQPDSKVKIESAWQSPKHDGGLASIETGRQIDRSETHE
jgi:hypothetical protein